MGDKNYLAAEGAEIAEKKLGGIPSSRQIGNTKYFICGLVGFHLRQGFGGQAGLGTNRRSFFGGGLFWLYSRGIIVHNPGWRRTKKILSFLRRM